VAITLVAGLFIAGASWFNGAVKLEEAVTAQYKDNQNRYDAFWKKVQEVAQVPGQYKNDFKDLLVSETQAKFGPEGSKAAFQWFKDRDINFDGSQYRQVMAVVESGRNDFKRSQSELLDKQRVLKTKLRGFFGRVWAGFYDFPVAVLGEFAPPKDLDGDGKITVLDYPIVTSAKTEAVFQEGKDNAPLKVFQ